MSAAHLHRHSYLYVWGVGEAVAGLFYHRLLWRINAAGRITTSLERSTESTKSHKGVTVIANTTAAAIAFSTFLMGVFYIIAFIGLIIPYTVNCAAGPWKGAAEVSPFSANWTNVQYDFAPCSIHQLGSYDNVTEAEAACTEYNAEAEGDERVCGGVAAPVCTEARLKGPFYV